MKIFDFIVKRDWDWPNEKINIKASNDAEAKRKFLQSNKYVVGIFTTSSGKNQIIENKFVDEKQRIRDRGYSYMDKAERNRKVIKKLREETRSLEMNHRYAFYLARAMEKKGKYLSLAEKKSIWAEVKSEFNSNLKKRK